MSRAIVLVVAMIAAACFESPTGPDAVVGTPFDLKAGAVSALPDGSRLRFDRVVADSRCPMDAVCVWAGDATLAVTLTASPGGTELREIHTQPTGSQISYDKYLITLTALAPYPRSSQKISADDYIATFVVTVR